MIIYKTKNEAIVKMILEKLRYHENGIQSPF
jgi:hypothetical protein